jgi:hypothetical protein
MPTTRGSGGRGAGPATLVPALIRRDASGVDRRRNGGGCGRRRRRSALTFSRGPPSPPRARAVSRPRLCVHSKRLLADRGVPEGAATTTFACAAPAEVAVRWPRGAYLKDCAPAAPSAAGADAELAEVMDVGRRRGALLSRRLQLANAKPEQERPSGAEGWGQGRSLAGGCGRKRPSHHPCARKARHRGRSLVVMTVPRAWSSSNVVWVFIAFVCLMRAPRISHRDAPPRCYGARMHSWSRHAAGGWWCEALWRATDDQLDRALAKRGLDPMGRPLGSPPVPAEAAAALS